MRIKNITDKSAPKPIGIGDFVIMPGETKEVPNEVAYIDEFDKNGKKTGKKVVLPAIVLLDGLGQIAYVEDVVKPEEANDVYETDEPIYEEKPKRGRKRSE